MPTLPSAASFGDRPTPEEQLPPVAPQGVEIAGQALAGAARQTFSAELAHIQAQNRYDLMVGRQQLITAQVANREKLQDDPDFATHEQRFRAGMQDDAKNVIANTTNPRIKGELAQYAQLETERGGLIIRQAALVKRHEQSVGSMSNGLEQLRQTAAAAPDEGTRATIAGIANDMVDAAIANNDINPAQGQDIKHRWAVNRASDTIQALPYDQQIRMLMQPAGTPAAFMEPDKRAELLRTAQRSLVIDDERMERLQDKEDAKRRDAVMNSGILMAQKGQLTPEWVAKQSNLLKPHELQFMFDQASGKKVDSNIQVYSSLLERSAKGEDVTNDTHDALVSGQLSKDDYTKLVSASGREAPIGYKRGEQYIRSMSGHSEMNPDPERDQTYAQMHDQWIDWLKANPKASEREQQIGYQDIVSHNMLIKQAGLPTPKFTVGSRLQMDIDGTEKATVAAFNAGQIDRAELDRQAQLLKEWRDATALQRRSPQAPK